MKRRDLIKSLAIAGGLGALPFSTKSLTAAASPDSRLLVSIQLTGGVDVTSFCDPKANVSGELDINNWSNTKSIGQVGNLTYAPFGGNEQFFQKYVNDILVINGVDAQTNSHSVGVVNNWSGRNAEGLPTITSLMAAATAPDLPLAYLNFGGFGHTQGIIRSTRIDQVAPLRNIIYPNQPQHNQSILYRRQSDWDRIRALHDQNATAMAGETSTTEGNRKNREFYLDAYSRAELIKAFGDLIPSASEFQAVRNIANNGNSTLHRQIQLTMLAFLSGVSISADLIEYGYDTHDNHDQSHEPLLANSTDAIDYLWTYAEELGLADRLVVLVGSDFGRTPNYNSGNGKDHWPIGSYMVMEKNAAYTNKVYGETDGGHNAYNIDPATITRNDSSGITIKPAHVHKAMRKYLGIEDYANTQNFLFTGIEDFNFFG
ncbi:MAG: hypothetical protein ACI9CE_001273 [Flavobacterium sp.]|jgi:hypothetical protein